MRPTPLLPLFLLCACGPPPPFYAPDAPGPHPPGTLGDEFAGSSVDHFVQVWFPTLEADAERHYYGGLLQGKAVEGAPDCPEPRPVVMFSHGSGGISWQSIFLTEHLASHGYVVVAPDHTFNTLTENDTAKRPELIVRRPQDITDAFDWVVAQSNDAASPLAGCVDAEAGYAIVGHSFGGYTSLATGGATLDISEALTACQTDPGWLCPALETWAQDNPGDPIPDLADPRVWAITALAPTGFHAFGSGLADIEVPTMVLVGTRDDTTPLETESQPIYDGLAATPRYLGIIEDAGHLSFSITCSLVSSYPECDPPFSPPEDVFAPTNALTAAFLAESRGEKRARDYLPVEDPLLTWREVR